MTKSICDELKGLPVSKLMAVYFATHDGDVNAPTSVVYCGKDGGLHELSANGCGRIRREGSPIDRLFFDNKIGYTFLAPLLRHLGGALDGGETVQTVLHRESSDKTVVALHLDNDRILEMRFEDDEIYFGIS
ncbi:hypothetical protein [Roseibium sp. RKSG952]|uniref:hypothetical protein n=1 Tax=Roseibium sp. RKSG952 TaxID=2529384 RepID=UPI0012BD30E2|nr:hypothetical protein [Roseibium sp. RKSG952]MTI02671.1 hypothetical protein [Roseibium sp. RKSG952]